MLYQSSLLFSKLNKFIYIFEIFFLCFVAFVYWLSCNLQWLFTKSANRYPMHKRTEPFINDKPKWQWRKVQAFFSTKFQDKIQTLSLNPTTIFETKINEIEIKKLKVKLTIDTQRSPSYSSEIGWSWHKSRIFPPISLRIDLQDEQTSSLYSVPNKLKAFIFAAKAISNTYQQKQSSYFEDVGIVGQNIAQVNQGLCIFDGIRFQTTSYINEGVKLHLIIILTIPTQNNQIGNIITSVVSSPMFIDSRKFAREYHEKKLLSFIEIFEPKSFSKNYIKSKDEEQNSNNKIQNNILGLYNYLTATNIRHKIKHPIYLAVKFSNVFHLMYNLENQQQICLQQVFIKLQKVLVNQIEIKRKNPKRQKHTQKSFLIEVVGLCNNYIRTKILECLQPLNCNSIQIIKQGQIKQAYQNIFLMGHFIQTYTKTFKKLALITKQLSQESERQNILQDQQKQSNEEMKNKNGIQEEFFCKFQNIQQEDSPIYEYKKKIYKRKKPLFSSQQRKERQRVTSYADEQQKYLKLSYSLDQVNKRGYIMNIIKANQQNNLKSLNQMKLIQSQTQKILNQNLNKCEQFQYIISQLRQESNMLRMNLINQIDMQNKFMLSLINNNLEIKNEVSKDFNNFQQLKQNINHKQVFSFRPFVPGDSSPQLDYQTKNINQNV